MKAYRLRNVDEIKQGKENGDVVFVTGLRTFVAACASGLDVPLYDLIENGDNVNAYAPVYFYTNISTPHVIFVTNRATDEIIFQTSQGYLKLFSCPQLNKSTIKAVISIHRKVYLFNNPLKYRETLLAFKNKVATLAKNPNKNDNMNLLAVQNNDQQSVAMIKQISVLFLELECISKLLNERAKPISDLLATLINSVALEQTEDEAPVVDVSQNTLRDLSTIISNSTKVEEMLKTYKYEHPAPILDARRPFYFQPSSPVQQQPPPAAAPPPPTIVREQTSIPAVVQINRSNPTPPGLRSSTVPNTRQTQKKQVVLLPPPPAATTTSAKVTKQTKSTQHPVEEKSGGEDDNKTVLSLESEFAGMRGDF